jgi:hypothetical protein
MNDACCAFSRLLLLYVCESVAAAMLLGFHDHRAVSHFYHSNDPWLGNLWIMNLSSWLFRLTLLINELRGIRASNMTGRKRGGISHWAAVSWGFSQNQCTKRNRHQFFNESNRGFSFSSLIGFHDLAPSVFVHSLFSMNIPRGQQKSLWSYISRMVSAFVDHLR